MKWAFVDYENVGSLERVNLAKYDKVIVLAGAKQSQLNFGTGSTGKPVDISYIKVESVSKNNVDLHLAYYLAVYGYEAPQNVRFEVISNDRAFEPLLKHINLNGRICTQIGWSNKPKDTVAPMQIKGEKKEVPHLIKNIVYMPLKARPKSVDGLHNHIKTYMSIKKNVELEVQRYINELVEEGVIYIDNKSVKYNR